MKIFDYLIPFLIVFLIVFSLHRKVSPYESFINGSKASLKLVYDIFPFIATMFLMLEIFNVSKLSQFFSNILLPINSMLKIPTELNELIFIKPFSGSGSMAIVSEIFKNYGVDSYIGRCASVIASSSETVLYISTVYFSKTNIKKLSYVLPLCLFLSYLSSIIACLFCKIT